MSSKEQLKRYTGEVERVIRKYLPREGGYQKTVLEAMNYSMNAGGKRLRPLFMREVFRLFAGRPASGKERQTMAGMGHGTAQEHVGLETGSGGAAGWAAGNEEAVVEPFMAAIEMIHTFSLVHDDLPCMDNDQLRRGVATTWVKYGYDMAVLAGDALTIYAFETAARAFSVTDRPGDVGRCMGLLAMKSGINGMIGGQTVDVEATGRPVEAGKLDFIYRLKTGALLEASMMIGAVLGGANETQVQAVEKMASCVGQAFQIQDDILDMTGNEEIIGKPVLSDAKNEKTTYVTLHGMEEAGKAVRKLSKEAKEILAGLPGDHEFLAYLIDMLITREK